MANFGKEDWRVLQPKGKATMTPIPKKLAGKNPANPIPFSRAEGHN
jgi:hypothetical protein